MIDFLLILIIGVVTWCVASEGPWGAGLTFLSVLFSGLIAMNWFEPLAGALDGIAGPTRSDVIALVGLFAGGVLLFRFLTEYLMPTYVEVHGLVYNVSRWGLGLATGYVTMAILLTALHVAPFPREFMGFRPERKNLFEFAAPDRQWLALTQYVSETSLQKSYGPRFDGPSFERIPGDPQTMQTWSSFPIRYAHRRDLIAGGGFASTAAAPPPPTSAAPQTQTPQGGGGTPNF
jgi:hypothetical protein